ncbi:uncharacterized protein BO66DRAFT_472043 [Aspergillus aculeatinus CBS 121060]|uniref:Uncharacterized protein n=1 Tax=Aspergillus aculeatinus CBS 121060 TaxID=1448322 RepID=A0ACD1H6W1_9EURO|nr:hypothetical protein BO66DRAFT_472043 [Aspergillus aculeatinus CBS 121060]RAH69238.1 hypothetical protein BO66DRAFT_472043 [Aspergillus aculeatinus CBS 121060]
MTHQVSEQQAKLTSLFEESLGKAEYARLLASEPSVQKYLDAGERLSFESIIPFMPSSSHGKFSPEQKDRYWKAILNAITSDTPDYGKIKEETAEAIWEYRTTKDLAVPTTRYYVSANKYDAIGNLNNNYLRPTAINSGMTARTLSFFTENFDINLLPLCANVNLAVGVRKAAIQRVLKDAENHEKVSRETEEKFTQHINNFVEVMGSPRLAGTSHPSVTAYNVERLLTPDDSSAPWPLQMATSISGRASTRLKISGLLAIGTEEAKITSLILSAAERARRQRMTQSGNYPYTLEECVDIIDGYMRELRGFWRFTAADYHAIFRWLEDGAELIEIPEILRPYLENTEKNHLYRVIAMQLRGYSQSILRLEPMGESTEKDWPEVTVDGQKVMVEGKEVTVD